MNDQTERPDTPYTVVVGVSLTSKSPAALAWGAAQARANDGRLIAARIWRPPSTPAPAPGITSKRIPQQADLEEEQRSRLEADVAEVLGEDHDADVRLIIGGKRRGLLQVAEEADLLVIDAPRKPSMSPMLAQRIVYAARCPVVVMPPHVSGQPTPASRATPALKAFGRAAARSAGSAGRPGLPSSTAYRPPGSE